MPACGAHRQKDPFTPCLRCHRPSFPEPVSCSLSCEDPCHTGLPRGNHLNGTSATTPFQMGSQLGFWDAGPQHGLPTIPPTQAPPRGPQGWATELGHGAGQAGGAGRGGCGKGCWGHLPPPRESGLRARMPRPSAPGARFTPPALPRLLQGWMHRGPLPA